MLKLTSRAIALTALVAPAAFAQQTGRIIGTVIAADTRSPISHARVAITTPQRVALTDDRGAFTLRDLPAGTYKVYVSAIGRAPDSSTVSVSPGGAAGRDFALREGSLMLSTVIVSATRTPIEASQVAATVNVLTPEQVRQSPSREVQDMLREIPSIELPRQSSLVSGTAQIVSIRGVDEGRTAVLFDGVPINDAWGEWIDWGRVPKSMLDHVEVVEGGTSSLYGNGAMGGLISFFSRPMAPGSMDLQVDGGNRDARHAYVAAGVPLVGALTASITGDYQEKGGYRLISNPFGSATCPCTGGGTADVESNVIQRNSYMRLNYAPSSTWSLFATGHLFGDSRGLGTPLTFADRDQRDMSLGFNHESVFSGALAVRAWDSRQIENQRSSAFESAATRATEDSSLTAQIPSHDWGASAQWTRSNAWHLESFSLGTDFRHYQGDYNEVDFNTAACATAGAACHGVTQRVSSGGDQSLSGAFVQAIAAPWSRLRIEASARVDQWDNNDGHSLATTAAGAQTNATYPNKTAGAFSPRLGLRYQLTSTFSVRAAAYKAFRAPNLAELYRKQVSASSITIPNPELSSENALGREAGFDWQPVDWLQARGTWYVADYNNFNVPTNLTTTTTPPRPAECGTVATCRTRLNVTKVRSQGGEASVAVRPVQQLYVSAGVNYDDARQQTGLAAGTADDHKPHVNRVPSPKQTIRGTWTSPMLGDWTAIWRHEGRTTTLQGAPLDPYSVVDANVQRELVPNIRGFVSIENLTNKQYMINIGGAATAANPTVVTQGLPRTFRVGVEAARF
ncbi:MAG TPA: TonB-dependent receptor [Gemmatimonadaceae bacterium]|jgi:outer membrane receptor protein involved in Fe transport|nr:TonB-dependent receptor [Gemmatimonadaceae bacterium]